jgi:hypothetical protein
VVGDDVRALLDRVSHVGPGVMSVYYSSLPFRLRADEAFDQLVVTVPKALREIRGVRAALAGDDRHGAACATAPGGMWALHVTISG